MNWPWAIVLCVLILSTMEVVRAFIERNKPRATHCAKCSRKLDDDDDDDDDEDD